MYVFEKKIGIVTKILISVCKPLRFVLSMKYNQGRTSLFNISVDKLLPESDEMRFS